MCVPVCVYDCVCGSVCVYHAQLNQITSSALDAFLHTQHSPACCCGDSVIKPCVKWGQVTPDLPYLAPAALPLLTPPLSLFAHYTSFLAIHLAVFSIIHAFFCPVLLSCFLWLWSLNFKVTITHTHTHTHIYRHTYALSYV